MGLCRRDQGRCSEALDYFRKTLALIDDEEPGDAEASSRCDALAAP